MMCGTWNVNAKKLEDEGTLADWLRPKGVENSDIYAIGCVYWAVPVSIPIFFASR